MDEVLDSLGDLVKAASSALDMIYVISPLEGDTTRRLERALSKAKDVLDSHQNQIPNINERGRE